MNNLIVVNDNINTKCIDTKNLLSTLENKVLNVENSIFKRAIKKRMKDKLKHRFIHCQHKIFIDNNLILSM